MWPLLLIPAVGYVLSTKCRIGSRGLESLRGRFYAHRGIHTPGTPENSLEAFQQAVEHGYGIELDVHLLRDGNLAVIHDHSLKRTASADISIEDLTASDLADYRLDGTHQQIPLLSQVLQLVDGKVPLIVELKSTKKNYARLTQAAVALLDDYRGVWCMESFDPRCIYWLKKHRPEIIRGQLAENFFRTKGGLNPLFKALMSWQMTHFLTQPDFVAYKFRDRKNLGTFLSRKLWGAQGVSWTVQTQEELDTAVKEGWIPIFEGFLP